MQGGGEPCLWDKNKKSAPAGGGPEVWSNATSSPWARGRRPCTRREAAAGEEGVQSPHGPLVPTAQNWSIHAYRRAGQAPNIFMFWPPWRLSFGPEITWDDPVVGSDTDLQSGDADRVNGLHIELSWR
ncbi:predicted protein [Chaetomium globosum CBS 148.51]|uniref:Uncharacterized protein n=1 Tax=Chaetomium globosum (strain ATCC 6205 / CBS 148.51 / DSM 1962 / NBRC 6347 / NRRL 1970) TaxID=306901 RepID=Q2HFR3_CHAGB|nr:uncharacterized protein CHGG_00941 [Chaetomium globosum CBS 148.51]EAQ92706.1 predicted protein [Chaetomium globosum CBS 148.51]